ncbi:TraB/GumN family protein [Entomomonas sp. E2T0]|uniref:TraB/GumN family protein n=1 Tax=Entomomonas sp. E2T0 TaxID=2930213 RepID=UPI0022283E78|nr:TraB/GumN family protein [Entomomonas sp. E2T0]UYZ84832.1 TraB/GumN family protein [Entomomonas sp. E2T0]
MIEKLLIKKYRIRLSFILLLSCFTTLVNAEHGIWVAKKGGQQITIVAITTFVKPAQWPLPAPYQKVLNEAEQVVFQTVPDGLIADINNWYVANLKILPETESLKDKVSADIWQQLLAYQDKNALFTENILKTLSPMSVCVLLYIIESGELGYSLRLQEALYNEAKQKDKIILSLSELFEDRELFMAVDRTDTNQYIKACLSDNKNENPTADEYNETVYKGDLEQINEWDKKSGFSKLSKVKEVIDQKKVIYARSIDELSGKKEKTLVYINVVGLIGEKGLLSLLQEKGYQISKYQE